MAKQLLIYERAVPVTRQAHGDLSVKVGGDFSYARHVNSVPLMAAEFAHAADEYTVVFAGQGEDIIPVVLLGVRDNENLFVDDKGGWGGKYVPAFLRRYPFVFSSDDDGANFTLCVDEEFEGCNRTGRGERLFDNDGERTQYLESVLGFLQAYQVQFHRTRGLTKRLNELGLFESMQARFTLRNRQVLTLSGFLAVNRERLKALSGEQLAELQAYDDLELIYLHLFSMRHLTSTAERIGAGAVGGEQVAEEQTAPEPTVA
ncbi:SapC protein [Aminobacter aminovorans]|uniref:SapC n=1 Tax=Aminobacter aminovorans TaxID=83263 RepID=A0A381IKN0_AMIAI|nr:SapC family protein [Aminobacter aminovorans]TCS24891.1 SapC protein [Aminobacter aminovorans]SUY28028.1 SapC [Aminobacter aminovorans]